MALGAVDTEELPHAPVVARVVRQRLDPFGAGELEREIIERAQRKRLLHRASAVQAHVGAPRAVAHRLRPDVVGAAVERRKEVPALFIREDRRRHGRALSLGRHRHAFEHLTARRAGGAVQGGACGPCAPLLRRSGFGPARTGRVDRQPPQAKTDDDDCHEYGRSVTEHRVSSPDESGVRPRALHACYPWVTVFKNARIWSTCGSSNAYWKPGI